MAAGGHKKLSSGLVALSSAAIVAVYTAGFLRTKAAAAKMDAADLGRRPSLPAPADAGTSSSPAPIEPPADFAPAPTTVAAPVVTVPKPAAVVTANSAAATTSAPAAPQPVTAETTGTAAAATATAPATSSQTTTTDTTAVATTATPPPATPTPPTESAPAAPTPPMPKEHYKDGVYTGWGTSRHGDIQASVTIEYGRITAASIAQCRTRYSCSWVAHLPAQIVARQSPDCDYVSGATQSANAFYWAVVDALNKAKASPLPAPSSQQ